MIPARQDEQAEKEMNIFLRSVRVLTVHHELVSQGDNSFWSFCVEYMTEGAPSGTLKTGHDKKNRVDYKAVLSPDDFAVFIKLREWRKDIAAKEAVPVYTIFTNEQLAQIARNRMDSLLLLKSVEGVGEARIKKYGQAVIELIQSISKNSSEEPE